MLTVFNSGKILKKLKLDKTYAVFGVGTSFHPDDDRITKYVKIHPELSLKSPDAIKEPVVVEEPVKRRKKKSRRRKERPEPVDGDNG